MRYNKFVEKITKLCPEAVIIQDPRTGEIVVETGFVDDMGEMVSVNSDRFYDLLSGRNP